VGGANTTSFLAAHFAKRNTKNCGGEKRSGESEGGQKFLPPTQYERNLYWDILFSSRV